MERSRSGNRKRIILLGIILLFAISLLACLDRAPPADRPPASETTSVPSAAPLSARELVPCYALRTPLAYSIESQPLTVYGSLSSLGQENTVMLFRHDLTGVSSGVTYVIYTLSTAGITVDADYTLTLNWEASGTGMTTGCMATQLNLALLRQGSEWVPIHTVSTPEPQIDRSFGWAEYVIPAPYTNYLVNDEVKLKIEFTQQLSAPQTWTQLFYVRWVFLELRNDVAVNQVNAARITILSEGFTPIGSVEALQFEDGTCFALQRAVGPSGEKGAVRFRVEYDLGFLAQETLLGLRFSHLDWFQVEGALSYTATGNISLEGSTGNTYLCYLRQNLNNPVTPFQLHAIFPKLGDWKIGTTIQLLYNINYSVTGSATLYAKVDWATLHLIRGPDPIIRAKVLNETVYAQQKVWLNLTCVDGKAPITEIRFLPWNDLLGTAAGTYLYAKTMTSAGIIPLSLQIRDAEGNQFDVPLGSLTVLHRPISIALYLSEDPFLQEVIVQLAIKDIFTNAPLPLHAFSKTILKNGTWFRQQTHQTTTAGTFSIRESVQEYLDWNYTVTIQALETLVYEQTTVRASIVLSQCPPYLSILNVTYTKPLKANDRISLFYSAKCQTSLTGLRLYKNGTLFLVLPTTLGTFNCTFSDVGGVGQYYLYASNARGFQGYSLPFVLNISTIPTRLALTSQLNVEEYFIVLDMDLVDELNRSCNNVPLRVTIYDYGKVFYNQEVTTGMDGAYLIVHFDRFLDHSFTVTITSQETALYSESILSAGDLSFDGYPFYSIIGVWLVSGCVLVGLMVARRRLKR